jgi:hypothetical protein
MFAFAMDVFAWTRYRAAFRITATFNNLSALPSAVRILYSDCGEDVRKKTIFQKKLLMQATALAQQSLFMSRSAERAQRHRDALVFMRKSISFNSRLVPDDRDLLTVIIKNIFLSYRNTLTFLDSVIMHQMSKMCLQKADAARTYRAELFREMSILAFDAIGLFTRQLIPATPNRDDHVHYTTLTGDMYRYICEFVEEAQKWEPTNNANERYEQAIQIAQGHFSPYNVLLLRATVNFAVFTSEILDRREEAVALAKKTIDAAEEAADSDVHIITRDEQRELDHLRRNVEMWEAQLARTAAGEIS